MCLYYIFISAGVIIYIYTKDLEMKIKSLSLVIIIEVLRQSGRDPNIRIHNGGDLLPIEKDSHRC